MRKPAFCICENKDADQLCGNAQLISVFVFATYIVESLYFLNAKFQASSHLVWLYSPVCVGPCRKPRRPVFSQRGSIDISFCSLPRKLFKAIVALWTACSQMVEIFNKYLHGRPSMYHKNNAAYPLALILLFHYTFLYHKYNVVFFSISLHL